MELDITADKLREVIIYDADTGSFVWRVTLSSHAIAGDTAGRQHYKGYYDVQIDGKKYMLHRLAWLYVKGYWPIEIDHIDVNNGNNKFSNLREATRSQNMGNTRIKASNKSGYKGVSWHKATSMWVAQIMMNGKKKHLGLFSNPETAHAAYIDAAKESFDNFARAR